MRQLVCVLGLAAAVALAAPVVVARVQDGETRQALAGAVVANEASDIMAVTDSSGRCVVVAVPRKSGALLASRAGYLEKRLIWQPPASPVPDTVRIDLVLYADRPRVVTGRVYDAGTKLAVPGAKVLVAGTGLTDSAGPDGGFRFDRFPAGPQKLEASYAGYPVRSFPVQARGGETTGIELPLLDTANVGRVEGRVFDARTGEPMTDAEVAVAGTDCGAVTDSAGRYVIENVPAGVNRLLISREGYVRAYTVIRLVKDWVVTAHLYLRTEAPPQPTGK
jgi:hypothetical protein